MSTRLTLKTCSIALYGLALVMPVFAQPSGAAGMATPAAASTPLATSTTAPANSRLSWVQALQAARDNLDVSLARRALGAAQADILAADRAPFPVLTTKASQIDLQNGIGPGNVLTQKRIDKAIGVDWTYERGNKRELRTRVAQRSAAAAQADLEDIRGQQVLAASGAFFDLLAAQDRLEQVMGIERSAALLATTAARRVSAGDLSAQEAARTEIEAQRAKSDVLLAQLDGQRAGLALAQLIRRPEQLSSTALQVLPDWPNLASTPPLTDSMLAALIDQRADIRAAVERVQAAQALMDNANAQKKADITVGSSFDHYPGTSTRLLELRVQMPLQWNYNYEGEIGRAQAQLAQAQDALDKTRLIAGTEMQRLQQELIGAAQRTQAYEVEILPRARRVAEGAELAYGKGAIPLTDLIDARRTLRATLLDALSARADHAKALSVWQLRTDPQSLPGRLASNNP